jgi:hypothetical protein
MSHEIKLEHMAVAELAHKCAQETENYFHQQVNDSSYCFELFRRAIQESNQTAWEIVCIQYQPLVTGWVKKHRGFETTGEEVEYFVNGAFGKIAATLTPVRFDGFPNIGSLLRYLKMCVHSVIVDYNRAVEQANLYPLEDASEEASTEPATEDQALDRSHDQALWDWINAWLDDEKERRVIYGLFVLALKPQEVYEHFRTLFSEVDEIYRVKQNVIARLRRNPEFRKFLGEGD